MDRRKKLFRIWFDHPDGVYAVTAEAKSEEELTRFWEDDLYFICVSDYDSEFRPEGDPALHRLKEPYSRYISDRSAR